MGTIRYTFGAMTMTAQVDGPTDTSLPLVILLHGAGGTSLDMTDPGMARPDLAYNRAAVYPPYSDAGFHPTPVILPVAGFFADPATPVPPARSWQQALNAAGFTTVTYTQVGPTIATDAAQLAALVSAVSVDPDLGTMKIAIVAHSRGGLVARAFLIAAAGSSLLKARMTALVTLHSPHLGSGLANLAGTVDSLLATVQATLSGAGITPPGLLASLRSTTANPSNAEMSIGSPVLAAMAKAEPVPGVTYHTCGGTSTAILRLWGNVYTPDSALPLPLPFPLFHWGTTPVPVGTLADSTSFIPVAVLAPTPLFTELTTTLTTLAATTPEFLNGAGDLLVTDARARLPFAATHTTNPINHADALWEPGLQAQVISILIRLRNPAVSGHALARLNPYPASAQLKTYTVTAEDAMTGVPLASGLVTVIDAFGSVAFKVALGAPFTYAFKARRVVKIDPDDGSRIVDFIFPSVAAELPAPYGTITVDTGL